MWRGSQDEKLQPQLSSQLNAAQGPQLYCVEQKNLPAEPSQPLEPGKIRNCHYFKQVHFRIICYTSMNSWTSDLLVKYTGCMLRYLDLAVIVPLA